MKKLLLIISLLLFFSINTGIIHAQECVGSLPSRLGVNMRSQVKDGNSLNMRTSPEQGDIIATLPEGAEFTIVSTSVCGSQNGLRWWSINWNGKVGWIAEGDLNDHWITQPASPMFMTFGDDSDEDVSPTAIPPTEVPSTGVVFNDLQYVQEDDGIRFWLDVSITAYANRELSLYLWFVDVATDEYVRNPSAHDSYSSSTDTLFLGYDIQPCCESVTYGIGDIQMFMPYDQFPAGDYSFYPQITIYDEALEFIEKRSFSEMPIPHQPPPAGSATILSIDYQFADEGLWFLVDMTVRDRANENLTVYLWFMDEETGDFVRNPIASDDHRNASNSLLTSVEVQPASNNETYADTDVAMYIPYYEFPREFYNYSLFVTLYDSSQNRIAQHQFAEPIINSADHPFPASGILIHDVTYTFEDAGVRFYADIEINGFAGQELDVYAFFRYYNDEYIQTALPLDDYYSTDKGSIIAFNTVTPCCAGVQAYSGDDQIELYVPYNVFPVGTYSYYPVVGVGLVGETESIKSRFFPDKTIDVLGDDPPAGYIVNYRIDELDGVHPSNNNGMANSGPTWDDLLLIYSLYEIDRYGTTIPGDQGFWTGYVWPGTVHWEGFETILLDVLADSNLVVRAEFTEVVDLEATEDAVDALRDVGKVARRGARFLPRLFRIAAKSAARYVNGMLLFYDIMAFFEKDTVFHTYERSITPDELYQLYLQTGAVGETWLTEDVMMAGGYYRYDLTFKFWLYGYAKHQARVD